MILYVDHPLWLAHSCTSCSSCLRHFEMRGFLWALVRLVTVWVLTGYASTCKLMMLPNYFLMLSLFILYLKLDFFHCVAKYLNGHCWMATLCSFWIFIALKEFVLKDDALCIDNKVKTQYKHRFCYILGSKTLIWFQCPPYIYVHEYLKAQNIYGT